MFATAIIVPMHMIGSDHFSSIGSETPVYRPVTKTTKIDISNFLVEAFFSIVVP